MKKTLTTINLSDYPVELHKYLTDADIYDSSCGENSQVLCSSSGYYIKIAPKGSLEREAKLTDYFYDNGIGAQMIEYLSANKDYMVTRQIPGQDATHYQDNPEKLCEVLANTMKYIHGMTMDNIIPSPCMEYYAADNILETDTFIHGDFCLPNIMLEEYTFKAFLDVGFAGEGDGHIDLFWVFWGCWFNLKTDRYTDLFLDLYGRENIDMGKLKYIARIESKL